MTWEELTKVPFHFVANVLMEDRSQTTYSSKDGRIGFCDIQPMEDDFPSGRCKREWRIDSTWYKSKRKFLEALKEIEL